jgi:succinate-acetate transporter protein
MENIQEVKVQTKEWSNPTAAGLVALAVACFCFFALLEGHVDATQAKPLIGCWLIGGFVIQIIVAFLDLKEGNHAGGNTFLFFSAFFMLATGMGMLVGAFGVQTTSVIDGWAWLALTAVVILWLPAFFKKVGILSFIVLFVAIALPFIALGDIYGTASLGGLAHVPSYALLIAGLMAIYLSAAIIVNKAFGKNVYPMPQWTRK